MAKKKKEGKKKKKKRLQLPEISAFLVCAHKGTAQPFAFVQAKGIQD